MFNAPRRAIKAAMNESSLFQTKHLARRVRAALAAQGHTQKDAADMLGIAESTLSNKLTGKIRFNDAEIFSLSHWLGVPSDALLGLKPLEVA